MTLPRGWIREGTDDFVVLRTHDLYMDNGGVVPPMGLVTIRDACIRNHSSPGVDKKDLAIVVGYALEIAEAQAEAQSQALAGVTKP